MSKSQDLDVKMIEGGEPCPKCEGAMQRFVHSEHWTPLPGRNYYEFWDRCAKCSHLQHYHVAKVYCAS